MLSLDLKGKTIVVTGAAGFIGANLILRLFKAFEGILIVGIDNLNPYYDISLKKWRLDQIESSEYASKSRWKFVLGDVGDISVLNEIFLKYKPDVVVHLAAQAGVRWSIMHPDEYIHSNVIGFYNILECCRHSYDSDAAGVQHLVYASSSSVYGSNVKVPFSELDMVDRPVSLYAATKKSNELMAHTYSKLYNIPSTGLRFFTVYGPAGRPDMAYFTFTEKLRAGDVIKIFNYGNCQRDFTYIDDIVDGIMCVIKGAPNSKKDKDGNPLPPYAIYNIGRGKPVGLTDFVQILAEELIRADVLPAGYNLNKHMDLVPMQKGDVPITYADTKALKNDYGFSPKCELRMGIRKFAEWYREFYKERSN